MSYSVKLVNPQKKSEYTVRKWRMKQKFASVAQLTSNLVESFEELHSQDDSGLAMSYLAMDLRGNRDGYTAMKTFVRCIQHTLAKKRS